MLRRPLHAMPPQARYNLSRPVAISSSETAAGLSQLSGIDENVVNTIINFQIELHTVATFDGCRFPALRQFAGPNTYFERCLNVQYRTKFLARGLDDI
jgi:hypothetical protein